MCRVSSGVSKRSREAAGLKQRLITKHLEFKDKTKDFFQGKRWEYRQQKTQGQCFYETGLKYCDTF